MNFLKLVVKTLEESLMAGGSESVFGSNTSATATPFSGDNYAPNDSRTPKSLFGGVVTRKGMIRKKRRRKNKVKGK